MTDNEIIKALECCSLINSEACNDCPLFINRKKECLCVDKLMRGALDFINRQKAEIERLEELAYLADSETANVRDLYFEEKSERAKEIKEFAERLKEKAEYFWEEKESFVSEDDIDNLVKEMVGADNAE